MRRIGLSLAFLLTGLLAGCIKPVSTAAPPTQAVPAGAISSAPQPGAAAQSTPSEGQPAIAAPPSAGVVEQFIQGRGAIPANLQVWYEQPRGPDQLQGFSFTNTAGMSCAGFLLTAQVNGSWQPNNGALVCAQQLDIQALASVLLFATTDGQPYTIVFGRVDDPTVSAVAVVFSDGSNQTVNPVSGGFLVLKPGVDSVVTITAINAEGNTVIPNIPQSPAG